MVLRSDIVFSGKLPSDVASTQPGVALLLFSPNGPFVFVYDLETIIGKSEDINGHVTNAAQSRKSPRLE
jgi:hypothetical protein